MIIETIQTLCENNGTTLTALCKEITGSSGNLPTWKKDKIRLDYLLKIADYFGVTPDYLLGYVGNGLTDEQSELVRISAELTTEEILKVIDYANLLKRGR